MDRKKEIFRDLTLTKRPEEFCRAFTIQGEGLNKKVMIIGGEEIQSTVRNFESKESIVDLDFFSDELNALGELRSIEVSLIIIDSSVLSTFDREYLDFMAEYLMYFQTVVYVDTNYKFKEIIEGAMDDYSLAYKMSRMMNMVKRFLVLKTYRLAS